MTETTATPAAATPTPTAPSTESTPVAAAPVTDSPTTTPTTPSDPAVSTVTTTEPAATQDVAPLFTIPEAVKLAPEAVSKFESFLKPKLKDGKVTMTSQEVLDHFIEQAKDANALWQKQIQDTNAKNEAVCKTRFTPGQLSVAETAVGFLSSFDPAFRDLAKNQLNDPVFVNAMRVIGERLSEDSLEVAGSAAPPAPSKRSPAERMGYAKPKPN